MYTFILDKEIDGNVGKNGVGDFDVKNIRWRCVDDLFARVLCADGVARRRRRALRHLRVPVAEVGRCWIDGRRGGGGRAGLTMSFVDVVACVSREVDERQLDALAGSDGDRPRTIRPAVAERLGVVACQISADVVVVVDAVAVRWSARVVSVQLGLSERGTVDRFYLTRCHNHNNQL